MHESNAALDQSASHEAAPAEILGRGVFEAVESLGRGGFALDVEGFGSGELHLGGKLVGSDPRFESGVTGAARGVSAVLPGQVLKPFALGGVVDRFGRLGEEQVGHGRGGRGVKDGPLVRHRQEAGREVSLRVVRQAPRVGQHHECRQVVNQRPEPVRDPGPHAREAGKEKPRVQKVARGTMHVRLRGECHQEGEVVDLSRDLRENAADPPTAFAMLFEGERRLHHLPRRAGGCLDVNAVSGVERFAVTPVKLGLMVERVHLAHAAIHEQLNDSFDLGRMRDPRARNDVGPRLLAAKQIHQRQAAKAAADGLEQVATGEGRSNLLSHAPQSTNKNSLPFISKRPRLAGPCFFS